MNNNISSVSPSHLQYIWTYACVGLLAFGGCNHDLVATVQKPWYQGKEGAVTCRIEGKTAHWTHSVCVGFSSFSSEPLICLHVCEICIGIIYPFR